jgi:hypothetical protein
MIRRLVFSSLVLVVVLAVLFLFPAVVRAQEPYPPLSEDAVRIAVQGVWAQMPTLSDISAAESDVIARFPDCSITEYPFRMQTPWSTNPLDANKMFMVIQCKTGRPRLLMLTYDFINNAFRFEGVMIPGIARDNPDDTATFLDVVDLIYLRAGWMDYTSAGDEAIPPSDNTDGVENGSNGGDPPPDQTCQAPAALLAGVFLMLFLRHPFHG